MTGENVPDTAGAITRLRTEKGLTQQELAERLHVSRSLVSMWELGTRTPDLLSVETMAELFGVDKSAVVPDTRSVFAGGELDAIRDELGSVSGNGTLTTHRAADPVAELDAFLSKQSQKDKALFMSRYLLMKTHKTIADEFGMNESTVRSRLARMRKKLRRFRSGEGTI